MNMHHTTTSAVSIRQKVEYTGDMANPSGRGAIVDMSGFSAVVILEDGRTITHPIKLIRHISERQGCAHRILALDEFATAAEILELQAAKVALESVEKAEADAKATAYQSQVERLKAEHTDLVPASDRNAASKNIRKMLKAAFPAVRFSVKKHGYDSIGISWEDGPTADAVEGIAGRFQLGRFDGMTDSYEYSHSAFADLFGGVRYVSTNRAYSDHAVQTAIDMLVTADQAWVPSQPGRSLYLRPFMIATEASLGFYRPAGEYMFVVISSPAWTYFKVVP